MAKKKPAPKKHSTKRPKADVPPRIFRKPKGKDSAPVRFKKTPKAKKGKWAPLFGIPSRLCPELVEDLCNLIRRGNYISTAATVLGINNTLLMQWIRKGYTVLKSRDPDSLVPGDYEYADLVVRLKHAHAEAEALDVARLNAHIDAGDSKALLKKMAIRYGKRWREEKKVEHKHEHTGGVSHTHAVLTLEDLRNLPIDVRRQMLEAIRKKGAQNENPPDNRNQDLQRLPAVEKHVGQGHQQEQEQAPADSNGRGEGSGQTGRKVGLRELPPEDRNGGDLPP